LIAASFVVAEASQMTQFIGRRVARVDVVIEGAPGANARPIQEAIDISPGQDFSPVAIRDSLVRLHRSGIVSGARVEGEDAGADGVALRFIVRPQARIERVVFEGNTVFPAADLRARLNQLDPGERLSPSAVADGISELLPFYSANGYYQARVTADVRLDDTGTRATVVYTITPGGRARVGAYTLDIKGHRIDFSKLKHTIVEGEPFTQAALQQEMDLIRQAYLDQNYLAARLTTSVTADLIENTVAITVRGESGPHVTVAVEGLELSEEDKRELLPFYARPGIDDFSIEEGRRRLQDDAQRKGYFFAGVTSPAVPDLSSDSVRLDYQVDLGSRYRLTDIDFEGLDAIPSQDLQAQLRSKEASFFPFFGLGRGVTSNDMLRQDTNLVLRRLRDMGYRRAHVDVRRGVSVTGENLLITFDVTQGPRTYVDEIAVRGNYVLTTAELVNGLDSEAEEPLVAAEVGRTVDQLLTSYNSRGYPSTEVITELVELGTYDGRDRVRLVFNITEGYRARIRRINTRGAALTKVSRLERDFYLFKEGEWLRTGQLEDTERVLYETDAFSSVAITSESAGPANGIEDRDVNVDLLEAKRLLLVYGAGYQSSKSDLPIPGLEFLNGARGVVQLTNTNMLGRLYTGSVQFRVSQDELLGQLSFQDPRPFGLKYPTLISVLARRLAEQTFRSDRYTALIQTERKFSENSILYMSYNFERVSIFDPQFTLGPIDRDRRTINLGRIGPSFLYDSRDSFTDPKTGTVTLGSFNIASTFLGGSVSFLKGLVEHSRYYQIPRFRDTVYSFSGRVGLARPIGDTIDIPISERFFAGGSRDLRGFGFEEAGPRDPATGKPLGGNAVIVLNNELRFPVWGPLGGTVFADIGNVFARVKDTQLSDLTGTLGFGLRVKTPLGPVRFDVGFLVFNKPAGVPSYRRHLTVGQTF
jgi:outer membrane protein insertion porin family